MNKLIHYTTLLNSFLIFEKMSVKFANLINSNDELEKSCGIEDNQTYYLFCTSRADFDTLMWLAYARGEAGAAIEFEFKDEYKLNSLFIDINNEIDSFEIDYQEEYFEKLSDREEAFGKLKSIKFAKEKEYRYMITDDCYSNLSIFKNINLEVLRGINLYVIEKYKDIAETYISGLSKLYSSYKDNEFDRLKRIKPQEFIKVKVVEEIAK